MSTHPTDPNPPEDSDRTLIQSEQPATVNLGPRAAQQLEFPFLSPPQADDEIGRLGEYRVLKKLGEGGNGFVFRGEDPGLRRFVALKVMRPEVAQRPQATEFFLREGRSVAGLKSDHVVTIYQVGQANGVPFLAMEFLEGAPLDEWIKAHTEPVPLPQALHVVRDTLRGLAAAHEKGLIHRDIKPANLWIEKGTSRIKILDFGLTRSENVTRDLRLTADGAVVGTPSYMAPEQAAGKPVDVRADLFSVGTVFYHLLAGKNPFARGEVLETLKAVCFEATLPIRSVRSDVPAEYAAFLDRLHAKKPADRPADARAALDELAAIERKLDDQARTAPTMALPLVAIPAPPAAPPVWDDLTDRIDGLRSGRRPPPGAKAWLLGATAVAALTIVAGVVFLALKKKTDPKPPGEKPPAEAKKDEPKKADPPKPKAENPPPEADWVALSDDAKPNPFEKWVPEGDAGITFRDGVAAMKPGTIGWLRSPEEYADFELELECKVRPKTDSGIFLRAWPDGAANGQDFVEVQILDDDRVRGAGGMGAVFRKAAPTVRPTFQPDAWTTVAVRAVGNRVAVTVNGTTCVDAEVEFPRPAGHVGLQFKNHAMQFRNVRVRPLVHPDRAAAEFVLRRGGAVTVKGAVVTDVKHLPAEPFQVTQIALDAAGANVTDADLNRFRDLTGLRGLGLHGPITDAGLAALAKFPAAAALDRLSFTAAEITDAGLAAALAACPNLRGFAVISCPRLTGAFLAAMKDRPVESMYLGYLPVREAELRHLRAMPHLTDLALLGVNLTDEGLKAVGDLHGLRVLNLGFNPNLTDAGAKHLEGLAELHTLYFQGVPFRAAGFAALAKLPKLVALSAHKVADRGDADVAPLATSSSLERVSFLGTGVTDKALEAFAACKALKWFEVNQSKVTAAGVKAFKAARPNVTLTSDFD